MDPPNVHRVHAHTIPTQRPFSLRELIFFIIGIGLFILGIWLMSDMIVQFLKFFVGLLVFIIGLQIVLGSIRFRLFRY